jgi:heme/copper-type cytochrome/quinol oxidase subunit 3
MTSMPFRRDDHSALAGPRGAEIGRSGMVLFLVNEATLFACLVSSYFYLALASSVWPPAGIGAPSLTLPLIMTAALLSSSGVLVYAERELERGNRSRYRAGVVVTLLLGTTFLLLQAKEYAAKLVEVSPTASAYGSLFFTITGLHGAHVAFGLLFLVWSLLTSVKRPSVPARSLAIRNASLYWHFVDGVWLVILTSLYLSPRWS